MADSTAPRQLGSNLMNAQHAVASTRSKLKIGSSNDPINFIKTGGQSAICVYKSRTEFEKQKQNLPTIPERLRAKAALAIK